MRMNLDHSKVRSWWLFKFILRQSKINRNEFHAFRIFIEVVKNDFVHSSLVILLDFCHNSTKVKICLSLQISAALSHTFDSILLLWVKLWQIISRHVINIEVVSDDRVSINSVLISFSYSLSKHSWVFSIKQKIDSC